MGQKAGPRKQSAERVVKEIRRVTRRQFSAGEKIRIVLAGLRGEESIAELCRREGIVQNLYYRWSKEFLEAGKKRLAGDTARAAKSTKPPGGKATTSRIDLLGYGCACAATAQARKKPPMNADERRSRNIDIDRSCHQMPFGSTCAHFVRMRCSSSLLERVIAGNESRLSHGRQASITMREL